MTPRNDSVAVELQYRCMVIASAELAPFPTTDTAVELRVGTGAPAGLVSTLLRWWTDRDATPTIATVLATWRLAERDLDAATPGSDPWNEASERFVAARSEYLRLFTLAAADADSLRRTW